MSIFLKNYNISIFSLCNWNCLF